MFLYNRLKKIILISCMLTLIPTPAHAWGLDAAWNSVKTTMSSLLSSATLTSITKIIKENPAAVCFTTAALAFCGYQYWKRSNAQKSPASKPFKRPSLRKDTAPMPPAPQLAPATASPISTTSMPPLALTSSSKAQAQKKYQKPTKQLDSILVQPALGVAQPLLSQIVDGLEKSYNELCAQKSTLSPKEFEKQRRALEAQVFNLWLRCNGIHKKFTERFEQTLREQLAHISSHTNAYTILNCTHRMPLDHIQNKINQIAPCPMKQLLSIIFSCEFAKENYDAYLQDKTAIAHLEITDQAIAAKLAALLKHLKEGKQQPSAQHTLPNNRPCMLRWRDNSTPAQPQRAIPSSAASQTKAQASTQLAPIIEEPQTIAGFVDGLEKELKKITQDRQKKSAEQLENELLNLGIQAFNLKLRCGDIQGKFKERFNIPKIYKMLKLSPSASLADVQKVITKEPFNKRKDIESIQKLFSCTLAKENYDAFLAGPGAIQALAIIDATLVGKIESLFEQIEKLREQTKKQMGDATTTHPVV